LINNELRDIFHEISDRKTDGKHAYIWALYAMGERQCDWEAKRQSVADNCGETRKNE